MASSACRTCHTAHNQPGSDDLSNTFFLRVANDQSQLCQSCHAAHGSQSDKLLVVSITDNKLCISCHERLRPGQWGTAGHTHPVDAPLNDAQRVAISDMGTHLGSQGNLACLSCHRLHDSPTKAKLLADTLTGSNLCLRCHADRATVAGTLHDLRKTAPTTRNALGKTADDSGPCGACHIPHQSARTPLAGKGDPTGDCLSCHGEGRLAGAKGATTFMHPANVDRGDLPTGVTLAVQIDPADPGKANLTCLTCHNPHDASRKRFLRKTPDELCGSCHVDQVSTLAGSHDFTNRPTARNGLGQTIEESGKCGFCHNVHLGSGPAIWIATKDAPTKAADMCINCHTQNGLAADHPAPQFSHPTGIQSPATQPVDVALPLYDAAGQRVENHGLVQCASCHNPHADSNKSARLLRVVGNTSDLCLKCHQEKRRCSAASTIPPAMRIGPGPPPAKTSAWAATAPMATIKPPNSGRSRRPRISPPPTVFASPAIRKTPGPVPPMQRRPPAR
jgi:predicted CXXCH cytochrome family protein